MKDVKELGRSIPVHDYSPALQGAVSWLGKRYLLAEPLNRRGVGHKPHVEEPQRTKPVPLRLVMS